jgi:hypothetical protein
MVEVEVEQDVLCIHTYVLNITRSSIHRFSIYVRISYNMITHQIFVQRS